MAENLDIRNSSERDLAAIASLYADAFPEENLLPLVQTLTKDPKVALSLVGTINAHIAGHVIFTLCRVSGAGVKAALLGPLAVLPTCQHRGIGSAMVRAGLQRVDKGGVGTVFVLGDPAYYGRFGFRPEYAVHAPYRLPTEWRDAWQSLYLRKPEIPYVGKLCVPQPWAQPALWAP